MLTFEKKWLTRDSRPLQEVDTMTEQKTSKVGFTAFAETWNGRLAMLGFVIGVATELLTGQGILSQLGLL